MRTGWRVWCENALILLGILTIWPWILGYRGAVYRGVTVVVLILLAGLAVVRLRRFRRALDSTRTDRYNG